MHAPKSSQLVPRLEWLREAPSTNSALVAWASGPDAEGWPDLSVVVTDTQTQGRGRLGRSWSAPAGASLAISILLRPQISAGTGSAVKAGTGSAVKSTQAVAEGTRTGAEGAPTGAPGTLPIESLGWLPLIGGSAMALALNTFLGEAGGGAAARAVVKWPNDVLIGGAKISGVLSELIPGANGVVASGVVVGAGVNLFLTEAELPVPTATSLTLAGASGFSADDVLAAYLAEFARLYRDFMAADGDAAGSGIARTVTSLCSTIGQPVRVELPGGELVTGLAAALDPTGRLVVTRDDSDAQLVVAAGDVTHVRY